MVAVNNSISDTLSNKVGVRNLTVIDEAKSVVNIVKKEKTVDIVKRVNVLVVNDSIVS